MHAPKSLKNNEVVLTTIKEIFMKMGVSKILQSDSEEEFKFSCWTMFKQNKREAYFW